MLGAKLWEIYHAMFLVEAHAKHVLLQIIYVDEHIGHELLQFVSSDS